MPLLVRVTCACRAARRTDYSLLSGIPGHLVPSALLCPPPPGPRPPVSIPRSPIPVPEVGQLGPSRCRLAPAHVAARLQPASQPSLQHRPHLAEPAEPARPSRPGWPSAGEAVLVLVPRCMAAQRTAAHLAATQTHSQTVPVPSPHLHMAARAATEPPSPIAQVSRILGPPAAVPSTRHWLDSALFNAFPFLPPGATSFNPPSAYNGI